MSRLKFYRKKHKYNAIRSKCNQGHYHPSKLEAKHCNNLHLLKKNGDIQDVETQKKFDLRIGGIHITNHFVDFLVTNNDGSIEVHETKGLPTQLWVIKKRLFEALYPEIPYIVKKA